FLGAVEVSAGAAGVGEVRPAKAFCAGTQLLRYPAGDEEGKVRQLARLLRIAVRRLQARLADPRHESAAPRGVVGVPQHLAALRDRILLQRRPDLLRLLALFLDPPSLLRRPSLDPIRAAA